MDSLNTLFDGLESELKPVGELYFKTYSFDDPTKSGGEKEWIFLRDILNGAEMRSNNVLAGISNIYAPKIEDLLITADSSAIDKAQRTEILRQRRMVLSDLLDAVQSIRLCMRDVFKACDMQPYQDFDPVQIIEFSDEHIPAIRQLEQSTYLHPIQGERWEKIFRQIKDEKKAEENLGVPRELHASVAVNPYNPDRVSGYAFTKTFSHQMRIKDHEYRTPRGTFVEKRVITEVMTAGIRGELLHVTLPVLMADMLHHTREMGSDRLESQIDTYHPAS